MKRTQYRRYEKLYDFLLKLDFPVLRKYLINRIYDESFYLETQELKSESLRQVASILCRHLAFETAVDIGCGAGQLLVELKKQGKDVLGCENSAAAIRVAPREVTVFQADAGKPVHLNRQFDLVVCIEVAEHIHKRRSARLVANCTGLGRQVFFTAAPRGQSGVGHINLQPYSFWIKLFAEQGFSHQAALSKTIQESMRAENVLSWITNNLMIFSNQAAGEDR
jgi:2-polyprenyl-3-methyl-5-hydroxy-6-metoxy-1,4-benzoquinol methylase